MSPEKVYTPAARKMWLTDASLSALVRPVTSVITPGDAGGDAGGAGGGAGGAGGAGGTGGTGGTGGGGGAAGAPQMANPASVAESSEYHVIRSPAVMSTPTGPLLPEKRVPPIVM